MEELREHVKTLIDHKSRDKIEEIIYKRGFESEDVYRREAAEIIAELQNKKRPLFLSKKRGFKSDFYKEFREKEIMEKEKKIPKVEKGPWKCRDPNCKSDEGLFFSVQTRSSDEGFTQIWICCKCSKRFKFS